MTVWGVWDSDFGDSISWSVELVEPGFMGLRIQFMIFHLIGLKANLRDFERHFSPLFPPGPAVSLVA